MRGEREAMYGQLKSISIIVEISIAKDQDLIELLLELQPRRNTALFSRLDLAYTKFLTSLVFGYRHYFVYLI